MSYHEPPDVDTQICDVCNEEKTLFENCNSDYCDGCKQILPSGIDFCYDISHPTVSARGPVRKYRICIDCSSNMVKEMK